MSGVPIAGLCGGEIILPSLKFIQYGLEPHDCGVWRRLPQAIFCEPVAKVLDDGERGI